MGVEKREDEGLTKGTPPKEGLLAPHGRLVCFPPPPWYPRKRRKAPHQKKGSWPPTVVWYIFHPPGIPAKGRRLTRQDTFLEGSSTLAEGVFSGTLSFPHALAPTTQEGTKGQNTVKFPKTMTGPSVSQYLAQVCCANIAGPVKDI